MRPDTRSRRRPWLGVPLLLVAVAAIVMVSIAASTQPGAREVGEDRAPNAATGGDPVIMAAGDIACAPGASVREDKCHQKETSDLVAGASVVLTLGDNQYQDGKLSEFRGSFDDTWGRYKSKIRPVPGNHDYHTHDAKGYYDYFGSAAGNPSKGYYSFNVGRWHLIALNSNCSDVGGCDRGSPQEVWLRRDLAANRKKACVLAYWHHPRFSSGPHGSDEDMTAFWQALYAYKADIVLNGHDHTYERFAPQTPSGRAAPSRGIRQFVVGTGGKGFYDFEPAIANSRARNSSVFGVLKLVLHPKSYHWEFVPEAGKSYADSGSATCVT